MCLLRFGTLPLLAACSPSPDTAGTPAATTVAPAGVADSDGGFVAWTQNGRQYRADMVSAFNYKGMPCAAVNGAMVAEKTGMSERVLMLTKCDPQKQRLAGTLQFTAKDLDQNKAGTQAITAGSFRITKLQAAPEGR